MARLTVDEENRYPVELYYEDHGSGRPVVLLHGWPLSSRSWESQVPALVKAGYRVIVYDRRGFGASSQPSGGYDFPTLAADLHMLLEHLDLRDATLVGFSMGAGEVAQYLSRYGSHRVSQVVFAAGMLPYLYRSAENPGGVFDDRAIAEYGTSLRSDRVAFVQRFVRRFFAVGQGVEVAREGMRASAVAMAAAASPKGTLDCAIAFATTDFRPDLAAVTVPVLVIHGDSDAVTPLDATARHTSDAVPGSKLVVVKGAPHALIITHASEFNSELLAFLEDG